MVIGIMIARPIEAEYKSIIIGGTIIVIVGIIDDKYDLKPLLKLIGQLLASSVPIYYGIVIDNITPFGVSIDFGMLTVPITLIWMIAIINAINIIDGLDGLATGVSIIARRSEEHTSELQSRGQLVCRLLLENKSFMIVVPLLCR